METEQPLMRRRCGAASAYQRLLEIAPAFRERQIDIELFTAQRRLFNAGARMSRAVLTIPVAVHVVYRTPEENISDAQIRSQFVVLNQDFRARNPDRVNVPAVWEGLVADARVEFALATVDPDGNATGGITRTRTEQVEFSIRDAMKSAATGGADGWPADRYLNIWVCNLGDGLLGYAQFPGGPPATDGVVILHSAFGTVGTARAPFDRGRTTTHEVGHWLNLFHIWGDTNDCTGSDLVSDTPRQQAPNYQVPTFPHVSCGNGPNGDMFMNYMDYVDDVAMVMFTSEQVERMEATLSGPRASLLNLAEAGVL